ncbi:MAG TPA: hypothetical protein PLY30_04250, partial [Candidatus Omnitrophota bacterium]|nr:hypothetical protein [Candidatus Omnitrophota bacterium]
PRISAIDTRREAALYDAALREAPLAIEKVLSEAYLQPKSSVLNDPRYQLQPPRGTPTLAELREGDPKRLSFARAEVRMTAIASIAEAEDATAAMERVRAAIPTLGPVARPFVENELSKFNHAYMDRAENVIWMFNGPETFALVVRDAAKRNAPKREVLLSGARGATQTYQLGDLSVVYYPKIDRDTAKIPQWILAQYYSQAGISTTTVGGGVTATMGQLHAAKPSAPAVKDAAAPQLERRIKDNLAVLNAYLEANFSKDACVTLDPGRILTPGNDGQAKAVRTILLDEAFGAKLEVLSGMAANARSALTHAVALKLLRYSRSLDAFRTAVATAEWLAVQGIIVNYANILTYSEAGKREAFLKSKYSAEKDADDWMRIAEEYFTDKQITTAEGALKEAELLIAKNDAARLERLAALKQKISG